MSELTVPRELDELFPVTQELEFSGGSFEQLVDTVGETAPEVRDRKPNLMASAGQLIRDYTVTSDFFAADDNAIGLLLAAGLHDTASRIGDKSPAKQASDELIATSFARTLFGRYSPTHPLEDVKAMAGLPPAERLALHLRYTNQALSDRLQTWFQTNDELRSIQQAMGIEDQAHDYKILVLSIGQPIHTTGIGEAEGADTNMKDYVAELHAKGEAFMREQLADPAAVIPYGYVSTILGQRYVCIMEPTARVLLEPETIGYKDDGQNLDYIRSLMKHEFAHSQDDISLTDYAQDEESSFIGLLLEEYRAEVFSGFGFQEFYSDIYRMVSYAEDYSPLNLAEALRSVKYGQGISTKVSFYATLISQFGLNNSAKLAGLLPKNYIVQSPKSSRELYAALDDGIMMNTLVEDMSVEDIEAYLAAKPQIKPQFRQEVRDWLNRLRLAAHTEQPHS
ncbi:MAG: hypothetical protein JWN38_497 [Candidatus Saccharibacteria bacterium]|nr:hypothetical protein [Candidatus Saccharibacteria bacterium]